MLKPFKFIVQAVVIEEDEEGNVVGETTSEQPNLLYGVDALKEYADGFQAQLDALNAQEDEK